jgi:non-ribosomal peptide synthetase-like protein
MTALGQSLDETPTGLAGATEARRPISDLVLVDHREAQGWRVRRGERLDHLFEERCDWGHRYGPAGQLAVGAERPLTYDELDARADQLARYLRLHGAGAGDRVGLLFDRPADSYVAMLAVLKIGAAFVPMDVAAPARRLAHIVTDAGVRTVLSVSRVAGRLRAVQLMAGVGAELVCLDRAAPLIEEQDARRLIDAERGALDDQLAYISYTTGPDGQLRGVLVDHRAICNFVKVAAEVCGIQPGDRVYQGLPVAYDRSVVETWVPWFSGATLVPAPTGARPRGRALAELLRAHRVTVLCGSPELLAGIEGELPHLRLLIVSGRGCPSALVTRWDRPGRRLLHLYGPTEAGVAAVWTELHPGRPTTLGVPLPTYSTVVLDTADPYRALPHGEIGEIGIAGIGLARGYRDPELTETAFIPDFIGIPGNPSGRIFRTGDRGRVDPSGQLEYHGPVQRRPALGQPTDLSELDPPTRPMRLADLVPTPELSPTGVPDLLSLPPVAPDLLSLPPAGPDLLTPPPVPDLLGLPAADLLAPPARPVAPVTADLEGELAEVLAGVLNLERVPVDGNFFDDLGADSMVMARFCARVRKRADLPTVSMKDIYRHSTVAGLAAAFAAPPVAEAPAPEPELADPVRPAGRVRYLLCGTLQLLIFLGYSYAAGVVMVRGYDWISGAQGLWHVYLRSVVAGGIGLAAMTLVPIVAKWVLIGRWKPQRIPLWSLAYVRFWVVKTLVRSSPLARFVGSPLYVLYLRALGAKIGPRVAIFSQTVPVCTDLLTIGAGTVVRKDSSFACYRAHAGEIQTGAVTLGQDVFVGEATVLDIDTSLGDGAQLGHTSSLHTGQAVPEGERWHGSPAQRTEVNYQSVRPAAPGLLRRILFPVAQLLNMLVVSVPVFVGGAYMLFAELPQLAAVLDPGTLALTTGAFYRDTLAVSAVLFFGSVLAGLLLVVTVPRVLNLVLVPGKVYPLYGFHYWAHRTITRLTNRRFLTRLFGDSSAIVHYLRHVGYGLSGVEQTGSNFGTEVRHENPFLVSVGSGTVVADGLSVVNADYSNSSFRVARASIGAHNFLGNRIAYPAGGRTGDNCLLATKVMVPLDGPVRQGVGLLGSPSFEIPRSVERDNNFEVKDPAELRRGLRAKNRHNGVSMALYLLVRWVYFYGFMLLATATLDLYPTFGAPVVALANVLTLLFSVVYYVSVDAVARRLQVLRPAGCSIYDADFWRHERFWKVCADAYLQVFNGTPFKNTIWRLLGVRIGRQVFDDGAFMTERSFTTIGDHCTFNAGSVIQCHSQEDGAFKSDRTAIGAGVTLGVGSFVHYGVTMGEGAVLAPDSFLMKGEEIPERARWGGNPAREMRGVAAASTQLKSDVRGAALVGV